jgi:hypothetical protein
MLKLRITNTTKRVMISEAVILLCQGIVPGIILRMERKSFYETSLEIHLMLQSLIRQCKYQKTKVETEFCILYMSQYFGLSNIIDHLKICYSCKTINTDNLAKSGKTLAKLPLKVECKHPTFIKVLENFEAGDIVFGEDKYIVKVGNKMYHNDSGITSVYKPLYNLDMYPVSNKLPITRTYLFLVITSSEINLNKKTRTKYIADALRGVSGVKPVPTILKYSNKEDAMLWVKKKIEAYSKNNYKIIISAYDAFGPHLKKSQSYVAETIYIPKGVTIYLPDRLLFNSLSRKVEHIIDIKPEDNFVGNMTESDHEEDVVATTRMPSVGRGTSSTFEERKAQVTSTPTLTVLLLVTVVLVVCLLVFPKVKSVLSFPWRKIGSFALRGKMFGPLRHSLGLLKVGLLWNIVRGLASVLWTTVVVGTFSALTQVMVSFFK